MYTFLSILSSRKVECKNFLLPRYMMLAESGQLFACVMEGHCENELKQKVRAIVLAAILDKATMRAHVVEEGGVSLIISDRI